MSVIVRLRTPDNSVLPVKACFDRSMVQFSADARVTLRVLLQAEPRFFTKLITLQLTAHGVTLFFSRIFLNVRRWCNFL